MYETKTAERRRLERRAAGYIPNKELDALERRISGGEVVSVSSTLRMALGYNTLGKEASRRLQTLNDRDK